MGGPAATGASIKYLQRRSSIYIEMRNTSRIALGFMIILTVGSCGSDKPAATPVAGSAVVPVQPAKSVPATDPAPTDPAATDPAPTDTASSDTASDSTVGPVADAPGTGSDFCNAIETLVASAEDVGNTETLTSEDVKQRYEQFLADIEVLVEVAPAEVAGDVSLVQEGFVKFVGLLEKLDFDQVKVFADPASAATLEESMGTEFETAGNNIDAYSQAQCGFTVNG
jgi:hypothetical protein